MQKNKLKKQESRIHAFVADLIANEIDNELAAEASITAVRLSGDGSILTIYVNFLNNPQKSLEALRKTVGYIRKRLASSLSTRRTPEIIIELDTLLDEVNKIEDLFDKIK